MFKKVSLTIGILLLLIGGGVFAVTNYLDDPDRAVPIVYSENSLLLETWNNYKNDNIEDGSNRTLDRTQNNITTSEGQSYSMLRAVWMDDRETFDNSWEFSKNNLQRDDFLLSWKFGERADGSFGILTDIGGQNTASDGDVDTALALLMAYSRWNDPAYLFQSKQMINSIWEQQVVQVAGKPVLVANDLEKNATDSVVVNPSYFAPYAFKLFSKVDPTHDWFGLVNNSYDILLALSDSPLGSSGNSGLPPNWIKMDLESGAFIPNVAPNLDTNYGYDALRTPFRMALGYQWTGDPRDKEVLEKYSFLADAYNKDGSLKAIYARDGSVIDNYETPAMYGGAIGYFTVVNPELGREVYETKLQTLYSPDRQQWAIDLSYYDDNWAWFGIALSQNALPNLAEINN